MKKMKLFYVIAFCFLVKSLHCDDDDDDDDDGNGITAAIVGAGIADGPSLTGTTVSALKSKKKVATSGSVENYSKWTLKLKGCEVASGEMNIPLRSVHPGYREGFAGYKTFHTGKGFHVCCTYQASRYLIHMMYTVPCNFNDHSNSLAVAVCPDNDNFCKKIDASVMYHLKTDLIKIKEFSSNISPLKKCFGDFCVTGTMGSSYQPILNIKVYPKKYQNLSRQVKVESFKDHWSDKQYEKFIEELAKVSS